MRLLLPPSESKRDGVQLEPLQLDALTAPALTAQRARVISTLERFCAKPTARVRDAIGTTVHQRAELLRNTRLMEAPTSPAHDLYSGVLFDAIGLDDCNAPTRRRIIERTLVQSALLGVIGMADRIPAYRCSADSTLPRIGRVGTFWRGHLDRVMPQLLADQLIIDLRSGTYASMWAPRGEIGESTVTVKVMQQERNGRRLAVSHMNKATKGQLVRVLGEHVREPQTPEQAAQAIGAAGYDVELVRVGHVNVLEVLAH